METPTDYCEVVYGSLTEKGTGEVYRYWSAVCTRCRFYGASRTRIELAEQDLKDHMEKAHT